MTFCLTCDAEKHPVQVFTARGMVDACPTCQGVFVRHDAPAHAPTPPPAPKPVAAPPRPVAAPATPGDALSLVDQMRARLTVVEAEIAARDGFLSEREMLRKMLAAADAETDTTQVVHGIAGPVGFTRPIN